MTKRGARIWSLPHLDDRAQTVNLDDFFSMLQRTFIFTPLHDYWNNLTRAFSGNIDAHVIALWNYGHMKFWSDESMITIARKP